MSALTLAFATGLSAACGSGADETAKSAAPASTGAATTAAASPSVDVKADTERICKNVIAAFDKEKMQLVELLVKLATEEDKAAQDKAKADAAALIERLRTVVDKETANAADPKVKTALQALVVTFGKMLTPEAMADPDLEKKMDAAMAEASAYCPGLNP
ncbi:hypothetical protein [Dactylosporangium sp. NPDC000521]|uniref:hypothetical protein n=1 Tax=Dactylosporangium sp. NPDC000521 TaxID=3363975 RepID=UPI003684BF6F